MSNLAVTVAAARCERGYGAHGAGPGDDDDDETPIGDPPDDDGDDDWDDDDDDDEEDDDEEPLQATRYCAAASPCARRSGTMAAH